MKSRIALSICAGALVLGGAAKATGVVDAPGPSYSPGSRPDVVPASSPSAEQTKIVGALGTERGATQLPAAAEGAFTIGALYEAGANRKTLVMGADDHKGRRVGVAAAREGKLCVVAVDPDAASSHCGSPKEISAGRVFTAVYDASTTMWISGLAPKHVDQATFIADDGHTTTAPIVNNTYLLTISPQSGGTLKLTGSGPAVQLPIPDATPPTAVVESPSEDLAPR